MPRAPAMTLKTKLILAGLLLLLAVGLYQVLTEGIEPSVGLCSKYSILCLR